MKNQKNLPLIDSGIFLDNINLNSSPLFSKNLLPKQKDIVFGFKNTIFSNSKKLFDLEVSKKISSVDGLKYSNAVFDLPEPIEINLKNYSLKNSILGFNLKIDEKSEFNTANLKFSQKYKSSSLKLNYFWADLHGQSEETIGTGSVEQYFKFARDFAFLDAVGHQGNDFQMSNEFWTKLDNLCEKFDVEMIASVNLKEEIIE